MIPVLKNYQHCKAQSNISITQKMTKIFITYLALILLYASKYMNSAKIGTSRKYKFISRPHILNASSLNYSILVDRNIFHVSDRPMY